jgi:radical SAM superfamily enzyme YgiQ (UPF0313 family)
MPPVGIISVLTHIRNDAQLKEVYSIDENNYSGPRDFRGMPDHNFLQQKEKADIAMFYGGMTNSIPRMFALAQQYKTFGAITIAGGSHVDALPEEALNSGVDIVVHGEGEHTSKELMDIILKYGLDKKELRKVKGISILDNDEYIFTGKRDPIDNLDELEDIDLTLVKFLDKRWTAIPINRGRGCNWDCEFCVVNKQYGKFKSSNVNKALRQLMRYSDMGYRYFFFTDDNFAQNPKEAIELCKMIGDYKRRFHKKIEIMVQVRNEVAENDELIDAMKFAGVDTLAIGFESPIDEELKAMKKEVTVENLIKRSRKLSRYFYIHGMFIFGYPRFEGEKTNISLKRKAKIYWNFFKKAKIDTIQIMNAVPLPGSLLRQKLEKEKRIFPLEMVGWDKYDGLFLCYDPSIEGIDAYELQNLPKLLMKRWYLGNPFDRSINYGRWMNWTYIATIGFLIEFGMFYTRAFFNNISKKRRINSLMPKKDVFSSSWSNAFLGIKRRWRNLFITTYGGGIMRRWLHEYKKSGHSAKMKKIFSELSNN